MDKNFKDHLHDVLKADARIWNVETNEFNETLLKDLLDKLDEKIIELILNDIQTKEKFFIKVKDSYVLKQQDIKFFIDENKLDNSYTKYRNKIGLRAGSKLLSEREEVVLDWPFKDTILEGGMTKEDQTRNEIFFNEVLAQDEIDRLLDPKALVNWKRYATDDDEKKVSEIKRDEDGTIRENLIVNGNNLISLHSLKKQFIGKVRLIYIDPPFNTTRDSFTYNDNFTHSTWLTFMKNRLVVAKDLLADNGNLVVQIDNTESHYLKLLLDEIFGRDNFVNEIIWHKGREGGSSRSHAKSSSMPTEYQNIFIYAKNKNTRFWNPPLGPFKLSTINNIEKDETGWFYTRGRMGRQPSESERESGAGLKTYVSDRVDLNKENVIKLLTSKEAKFVSIGDIWTNDIIKNSKDTEYDTAKPEHLLKLIIEAGSNPGDLVLDFFLGGGTTASVCLKLNRRFIGVEQLEDGLRVALRKLQDVVNGNDKKGISYSKESMKSNDFIYVELARWNDEAKEKILSASSLEELEHLFDELYERYFLNYNVKTKEFKEKTLNEEEFKSMSLGEQKKLFVEMLDMNQMFVNFSERHDKKYNLSSDDIKLSEKFYNSNK